jgi:hypothetical protein
MIIVDAVLDCLEELADARLQEDLWMARIPGQQSSPEEAMCRLFDDARLAHALDSGALDKRFSTELCLLARRLRVVMAALPYQRGVQAILKHSSMPELREVAAQLRRRLLTELPEPS